MKIRAGLELRRLGDEGILLDTASGTFYRLSPLALAVWEELAAQKSQVHEDHPELIQEFIRLELLEAPPSMFTGAHRSGEVEPSEASLVFAAGQCNNITDSLTCKNTLRNKGSNVPCTWNPTTSTCS